MHKLKEAIVELTSRCNLNCRHCGSDCRSEESKDELSISQWKSCIGQLHVMGVEKVVYSGGEPTLKQGFEELIVFTKELGLKYGFISNGFFLGRKLIQTISKHKPFAVGLSIDGLKKTHNRIRGHGESWGKIFESISILQDIGVQICIVTTVQKSNVSELSKLAALLDIVGIDSWQIQLAMPSGRMNSNRDMLIDEQQFKNVCENIIVFRKSYPHMNIQAADCFGFAPPGIIRESEYIGCGAGTYGLGIDAFGNVMPCLSLRTDLRCGNLKTQKIVEIWESDKFAFNREFDVRKVEGNCKKCEILDECRGGCASQSHAYFSRFHDAPFCFARSFCP